MDWLPLHGQMKRIRFIINPRSGVFPKEGVRDIIESELSVSEYSINVVFTQYAGHATLLAKEAVSEGYDIVVAVGGDGTVNEVARGVVGTGVVLAILPAGSGNGLAHHLKIPLARRKAIRTIAAGRVQAIDTGMMNGRLFVSIAGIGFDGLVARKFEKSRLRGFMSYLQVVTQYYPGYRPKKYRLIFPDRTIETRALFIVFANSDQFGFQTSIAPGARVDDGLLDVIIMEKPPLIELPYLAGLLYWRKIDRSKYCRVFKTSEVTVKTGRNRWANIDGEAWKPGKKISVTVQPASLKILLPERK
ncbi:MAG: diacylglycerol kinase family lipid kinase [Bacteroidales bacterium]